MVEIFALDKNFLPVAVFDTFESVLWIERYDEYSEFEIYTPTTVDALLYLQIGYYLQRKDSEKVMIIENIKVETDVEAGSHMTVTGRSLESILDRRIVWEQTIFSNKRPEIIMTDMVTQAFVTSGDERKVQNLQVDIPSSDLTGNSITIQYTGDNVYESIRDLAQVYGLGYRVTLSQDNKFHFSPFKGIRRTFDQSETPYVIFSPKYDNLTNSSYTEDNSEQKTIALVAGEGEGLERTQITVSVSSATGLERRELYVDARDLSSQNGEETLTPEQYAKVLADRGVEYLSEYQYETHFEGGVDPLSMFKYGEDYFIGDIVQIQNEYGLEATVRVSEVIRSSSVNGEELYPTFMLVEEEMQYEIDGGDVYYSPIFT